MFITAYDQYAIEAFENEAIDYLLEPIKAERLVAGLPKNRTPAYFQWIRVQQGKSLIRKHIKELADELDPEHFWQIHPGTIVNVDHISKVSRSLTGGGVLRLRDRPETLTVSQR